MSFMIRDVYEDQTLLGLCLDMFKRLEDRSDRRECVNLGNDHGFENRMTKADYLHYRFLKVFSEMYREGVSTEGNYDLFQINLHVGNA